MVYTEYNSLTRYRIEVGRIQKSWPELSLWCTVYQAEFCWKLRTDIVSSGFLEGFRLRSPSLDDFKREILIHSSWDKTRVHNILIVQQGMIGAFINTNYAAVQIAKQKLSRSWTRKRAGCTSFCKVIFSIFNSVTVTHILYIMLV